MCIKMSSFTALVLIIIACVFSNLEAADLSPDLPRCYRNDPNLNECLLKATKTIKPKLQMGIKEFGIPPINPYVVPSVIFEQGSNALNFKMTLTNLTIKGFDSYKFSKFDFDPITLRFEIINEFGPLLTSSHCLFEGHLLLTNLNGTGRLLTDTENTVFQTSISGKLEKKDGVDYYKVQKVSVTPLNKIGGKAQFENFLGVNENIIKAINKVLEENGDDLITEILPIFINFVEDFIENIYVGVFDRFSYNTLLPLSS